jgi:DNA-binding transcriptional LysR family regulator
MFAFTNRQIEIFLTVCEVGSFRQAAERIGISEAGVSHHIRALERQLDCPLFSRRRGARIELIQAGHAFREEALTFVDRGRELRAVAARHARQSPPLRAFVGGHLLEDFVRPALPRLAREHPEINLRFEVNRSRYQVRRQILAGEFDVVLLAVRDADEMPGSVLLSQVESGIYGTPRYAAQALREGLAALPFILSPAGSDDERAERRRPRRSSGCAWSTPAGRSARPRGSCRRRPVRPPRPCHRSGAVLPIRSPTVTTIRFHPTIVPSPSASATVIFTQSGM